MTRFQTLAALASRNVGNTVLDVVDPGVPLVDYDATDAISVQAAWESQPAIRKVTSFIASNVAAIPLHVYERAGDTDRRRITDGPLAAVITAPAPGVGAYRFWERVILDGLLYDRRAVMIVEDGDRTELVRIPPRRFRIVSDGLDRVRAVRVTRGDGRTEDMDPGEFLLDVGYSQSSGKGLSPIATLSALLREAAEAVEYRRAVMRNAARHTGWVGRETAWSSQQARDNFLESLRRVRAGEGREGGDLLLDEGMEWHDRNYKPTDIDDLEGRTLTNIEVAGAYHIAPELLGDRQGNYSNMNAFRQSLYRDALGPYIVAWEQMLAPLADRLAPGESLYVEAHVEAKLRGSFEEQASVLQTSTGAPWLTRNEARARQNLPAVAGGDDLVTPLNVLVGGQASPTDSGTQNEKPDGEQAPKADGTTLVKSRNLEGRWAERAAGVLIRHYSRQEKAVLSTLGAKAGGWWDQARWDRELGEDLYRLAATCVDQMGRDACRALGFDPDESWDAPRTLAYLQAVTKSRAKWVNAATRRQIEEALSTEEGPAAVPAVFERAKTQRSSAGAAAFIAAMAGFAAAEAAKQAAPGRTTKTWVTGQKPRPSHQAMNGETVPTWVDFSNGLSWPGDPAMGANEAAGCNCSINIAI